MLPQPIRCLPAAWLAAVVCVTAAACAAGRSRGATPAPPESQRATDVGAITCLAAFDSLRATIERDYAGYREKARGHEAALAALADSVRAVARTSDDHRICIVAMHRWTGFFRDPHLMVWQAAPPAPAAPAARAGGVAAASIVPSTPDPDRPALRFADDSTAVVRLPSLDPQYKPALDSVVGANRARLFRTPILVVDLRGNGGGCTCTYDALVPFVYGGPFQEAGQDLWASPANVALLRGWLADSTMPETLKADVRRSLPRIEAAPNTFVRFPADSVVRLDTVYPMPRAVAVLIDGGCASSCEDFVLMAQQSPKVTVVGPAHTAGVHDYGNVRALWLPGWRRLRVPTSRSRRLPADAIDNVGLAPRVWVPAGAQDTVRFASRAAASRVQR